MLKFGMIGAVNTGIDLGVFTLLTLWDWSYLPSQSLSYTCGVFNSYAMNRSWTFNERRCMGLKCGAKSSLGSNSSIQSFFALVQIHSVFSVLPPAIRLLKFLIAVPIGNELQG
jgi:putative flippase GtrA